MRKSDDILAVTQRIKLSMSEIRREMAPLQRQQSLLQSELLNTAGTMFQEFRRFVRDNMDLYDDQFLLRLDIASEIKDIVYSKGQDAYRIQFSIVGEYHERDLVLIPMLFLDDPKRYAAARRCSIMGKQLAGQATKRMGIKNEIAAMEARLVELKSQL